MLCCSTSLESVRRSPKIRAAISISINVTNMLSLPSKSREGQWQYKTFPAPLRGPNLQFKPGQHTSPSALLVPQSPFKSAHCALTDTDAVKAAITAKRNERRIVIVVLDSSRGSRMIALILVIGKVEGLLIYPINRVVGSTSSAVLLDHRLRLADFSNTGISRTT